MSLSGTFEKVVTFPGSAHTATIRRLSRGQMKKVERLSKEQADGLSADASILTDGVVSWSFAAPLTPEGFDELDTIENRFLITEILNFSVQAPDAKKD